MSRWAASVLRFWSRLFPWGWSAQRPDDVNALQARFDRENNSVRKAKLLEKLGDAQLEVTRRARRPTITRQLVS